MYETLCKRLEYLFIQEHIDQMAQAVSQNTLNVTENSALVQYLLDNLVLGMLDEKWQHFYLDGFHRNVRNLTAQSLIITLLTK